MKWKSQLPLTIAALAVGGCTATPVSKRFDSWRSYTITIPHFQVDVHLPPELNHGYNPIRTNISFDSPEQDEFAASQGHGVYRKAVTTFPLGANRNFDDWDLAVNIFVLKWTEPKIPLSSSEDLAQFARDSMNDEYILADGRAIRDLGEVTIEQIGPHEVVIATRADPYIARMVRIKTVQGSYTNQIVGLSPYQVYYLRLNDEVALGLRSTHDNHKKLDHRWYTQSHDRISSIINSLDIRALPSTSVGTQPEESQ